LIKIAFQSCKQAISSVINNRLLLGISMGHAVTHWYPVSFFMILPFIQHSLDLSYTEVGFIISIKYIVSALSNIPGGMIVDIIGKRHKLMAVALAWVGLPYFLMGFFGSYGVVLFCAALVGIGNNLWHPAAISELTNQFSTRKGWAIGIHSLAANIGDAIAPIFVGFLLLSVAWEQVVMINLLPGLLSAFIIWRLLNLSGSDQLESRADTVNEESDNEGLAIEEYLKGLGEMVRNPRLLAIVIISGVRSLTQNTLRMFLPLYFVNIHLMSSLIVGTYIGLMEFAGAVAAPISGHYSDKKGRKIIVVLGMICTALAIIFFLLIKSTWLIGISLFAVGFFLYSLRPVLFAWALEQVSDKFGGTTVGMMFGLQSFLSSMAPLLGGWIADKWGIKFAFYVIVIILIISSILTLLYSKEGSANTSKSVGNIT